MKAAASREVQEDYSLTSNSCLDVAREALKSGGFNVKEGIIPNLSYIDIKRLNTGIVIDLKELPVFLDAGSPTNPVDNTSANYNNSSLIFMPKNKH